MPRERRLVVPGYVHHVTQRGVRRQRTFFRREDYLLYLDLIREWCPRNGVEVVTHSLMPNHVHLAAIPDRLESLAGAMQQINQRYTRVINDRQDWSGSLWQGRFWSTPFDWASVPKLIQYILMNPVRAGRSSTIVGWPYSSGRVLVFGEPDGIVDPERLANLLRGSELDLGADLPEEVRGAIARSTRAGHPVGSSEFVERLERIEGRSLRPKPPGRPKSVSVPDDSNRTGDVAGENSVSVPDMVSVVAEHV